KPPVQSGTGSSWVVRRNGQRSDAGLLSDPCRLQPSAADTPTRGQQPTDAVLVPPGPSSPPPERPVSENSTVNVDPDSPGAPGPSSSFYQACLTPDGAVAADPATGRD